MSEAKHTPLPWESSEENPTIIKTPRSNGLIASAMGLTDSGFFPSEKEALANAAFIVKAVNSHYALLEACKKALTCRASMNSDVVALIESALAQATGAEQ